MNVSYPLETAKILMMFIGEKILKLSMEKEAKIDSTPLEASRHDKHADYNPHYECKMDKAHITMVGTYPVFMTYTKGLAGDSSELINHIEALKKMNANLKFYSADGGYDSFFNHSDIWYYLNAKPIIPTLQIPQSIKKVKMKESITGEIKSGKSVEIFMHQWKKLKFLYEIGRKEQVEMYLRNQNISTDETFDDQYEKRAECEKIHGHIKGTVKFDIRRVRKQSRKLYSLLSFIAYQLLVLTEMQNKVGDKNSFGRYF